MKRDKTIIIKDPKLKNLRNALRTILIREIKERMEDELELYWSFAYSICKCFLCSRSDQDMTYDSLQGLWLCIECQNRIKNESPKTGGFNNGVIVRNDVKKPCHTLLWCPYGVLVEIFCRNKIDKYVCNIFGHDCPAFYVSEDIFEISNYNIHVRRKPEKRVKLKDNLKNYPIFNDEKIIQRTQFPKPCIALNWCPYGTIGDGFLPRKTIWKFNCQVLPHDCPVFYHASPLFEGFDDVVEYKLNFK